MPSTRTASDKNYVIYTYKLSGTVSFLPTEQSVYSEKNMSIPSISYEITDGDSCTETYTVRSDPGYLLDYNFTFENVSESHTLRVEFGLDPLPIVIICITSAGIICLAVSLILLMRKYRAVTKAMSEIATNNQTTAKETEADRPED